jgi:hypothetical protein
MPVFHVRERSKQTGLDPRMLQLEAGQERFYLSALHIRVTTGRTGAAGYGETRTRSIADDIIFGHVNERPNDDVQPVILPL